MNSVPLARMHETRHAVASCEIGDLTIFPVLSKNSIDSVDGEPPRLPKIFENFGPEFPEKEDEKGETYENNNEVYLRGMRGYRSRYGRSNRQWRARRCIRFH